LFEVCWSKQLDFTESVSVGLNNLIDALNFRITFISVQWEAKTGMVADLHKVGNTTKAVDSKFFISIVTFEDPSNRLDCLLILIDTAPSDVV
jgi:hypothetical protein